MRVLVLGATGSVGRLIAQEGLARGHQMTALARSPLNLDGLAGRLRVVEGDALDPAAVARAVMDQDAVIYVLGSGRARRTTLFSESTRILLEAMERHGVRRLLAITGVGAGETKGHGGFLYDRIIFPLFTKRIYEDKDKQEALIRRSRLDWVIVRPASFRDSAARDTLQVVLNPKGVTLRRVSRSEVASFILDQLEGDRYLKEAPFIGHP